MASGSQHPPEPTESQRPPDTPETMHSRSAALGAGVSLSSTPLSSIVKGASETGGDVGITAGAGIIVVGTGVETGARVGGDVLRAAGDGVGCWKFEVGERVLSTTVAGGVDIGVGVTIIGEEVIGTVGAVVGGTVGDAGEGVSMTTATGAVDVGAGVVGIGADVGNGWIGAPLGTIGSAASVGAFVGGAVTSTVPWSPVLLDPEDFSHTYCLLTFDMRGKAINLRRRARGRRVVGMDYTSAREVSFLWHDR